LFVPYDDFYYTASPSPVSESSVPALSGAPSPVQVSALSAAPSPVQVQSDATTASTSEITPAPVDSSQVTLQRTGLNHSSTLEEETTGSEMVSTPLSIPGSSNAEATEANQTDLQGAEGEASTRASVTVRKPRLGVLPHFQRKIYPGTVELKAHSKIYLEDKDSEIFSTVQSALTPYLQQEIGKGLQAYNLEVDYSDGEDASDAGVIVTNMNVTVILSVLSEDMDGLIGINSASSTIFLRDFFKGQRLYQFLGQLRRDGVEINEISFLEEEFRSPIFADHVASVSTSGGQKASTSTPEPEKSKVGLIAAICVGMVVVGAVLFTHYGGRLPTGALRVSRKNLGELSHSIRESFSTDRLSQVGMSIRETVSRSSSSDNSSRSSTEKDGDQTRTRTWSGSLRRHPPGGIKAAALQKTPAFSKDLLNKSPSPSTDDQSFSIAGDYDVPDEYDFQATPISKVSAGKHATNRKLRTQEEAPEDEFSMPDDYNTVNEDMSFYSKNVSVKTHRKNKEMASMRSKLNGRRKGNPFDYSPSSRRGNDSTNPFASPTRSGPSSDGLMSQNGQHIDEWSVDSYTTRTTTPSRNRPSRHSPGSQLDMPPLS
jgi:hypothetical protein